MWAEETVHVDALMDKNKVFIGEEIHLTLALERPISSQVKPPAIEKYTQPFEIKDFHVSEKKLKGDRVRTILSYTFLPFQTGKFNLGPILIEYIPQGAPEEELKTQALSLEVKSLMNPKDENSDIRGAKPLLLLERHFLWLYLAIVIVAFLGVGVFFWIRKKISHPLKVLSTSISLLSPSEEALKRLEELAHSDAFREARIKEVYSQLSDILRHYLGRRFFLNILEMTTFECLKELKSKKLSSEVMNKIRDLLNEADLVKFAKYIPDRLELTLRLQQGIELVDVTKEISHAS
ncbi:MAG: hypothetical protein HYS07_04495 [Chlamydiae bacterium]|nr:hypothetical protein [Chlamydiota bacterium]MBI3277459.1 hypothetical protein [Chlamydiota bacterium]